MDYRTFLWNSYCLQTKPKPWSKRREHFKVLVALIWKMCNFKGESAVQKTLWGRYLLNLQNFEFWETLLELAKNATIFKEESVSWVETSILTPILTNRAKIRINAVLYELLCFYRSFKIIVVLIWKLRTFKDENAGEKRGFGIGIYRADKNQHFERFLWNLPKL